MADRFESPKLGTAVRGGEDSRADIASTRGMPAALFQQEKIYVTTAEPSRFGEALPNESRSGFG